MAALTVGRICMKIAGREAGRFCCVLKKIDDNFFLITGPKVLSGVKRRRCNVEHLEPTEYSVKIEAEASDKAVIEAYEKAGLLTKLGLKKPSPEIVKEVEKKEEKPKEKEKKPEKKEEKPKEGKKITIKLPTLKRAKKPEIKRKEKEEKKKPGKKIPAKKTITPKKVEKKKKTEGK